ncbi:ECF subfamily RNA polymerase sigma-24 factor, partial [mine drainage metagenome]
SGEGGEMARPLTKTKSDGTTYARPSDVEARIDGALQLPLGDLRDRLLITDRTNPGYLPS